MPQIINGWISKTEQKQNKYSLCKVGGRPKEQKVAKYRVEDSADSIANIYYIFGHFAILRADNHGRTKNGFFLKRCCCLNESVFLLNFGRITRSKQNRLNFGAIKQR